MASIFDNPYNPKEYEEKIYQLWEKSGFFNPDTCVEKGVTKKDAPYFSIVLPPPNVTGTLHLGHVFEHTLQDIMVRYHRMKGNRTLWVPGTDHAAIATQSKYEKELYKKEHKSRHDFSREEFINQINRFAIQNQNKILSQLKTIGDSVDWSRLAFTLDEKRELAVRTVFKKMYNDGIIYRGNRIVNWDPKGQTTISDDEVAHKETDATLYTFRYAKEFPILIATTRPETKVGDVAVAVHPDDARYKKYIGETYSIDFIGVPLEIKIVTDKEIDPAYGTGAVGITPAHSMVDWEIAERHGLSFKKVINEFAKMENVSEELNGKKTLEAREIIVQKLRDAKLLEKEEKIKNNIAKAERTGGIIEPLPKLQWFVDVNKKFKIRNSKLKKIPTGSETTLKKIMQKTVSSGEITIIPDHFRKIYEHWVNNLKDWCISRQILYGHRVPVWYCLNCESIQVNIKVKNRWFLVRHGETQQNKEKRSVQDNVPLNEEGKKQAEVAALRLKNQDISVVVSSDFVRCRETAEIISRITGAPIVYDKALRERSHGDYEGMRDKEIQEKYGNVFVYDQRIGNAESYKQLEKRVWEAFQSHQNSHVNKNVVIVSHAGAMRMLIKKIKNLNLEDAMTRPSIKNAEIVSLDLLPISCKKCGCNLYEQDPDTLDTWFSSALWTFSTLGWPDETSDLENYHPTSVINPGYEILSLWISRMIMMSGYCLGEIPFRFVYFHGIVRDKDRRKFSKSLNNGIDPIEIIYSNGTDALRMSLTVGIGPGSDMQFDLGKVMAYKHFANKIWNATRYVLKNTENINLTEKPKLTENDAKSLDELNTTIKDVTDDMDNFRFYLAAEKIYHYFWHTFADKIIEESKEKIKNGFKEEKISKQWLIRKILETSLQLLHPFMPFVTETIWQEIHPPVGGVQKILMVEKWPQ
ncbi:MAG: class I tRNA ligase family protein [Patescibacteria group bacterium]